MASDINFITRSGTLGEDAGVRVFPDGGKILTFRIASNKRVKDKGTGDYKDLADWIGVVVNGPAVEWLQALKKGDRVVVTGEVITRSWEKDNKKQYATEIRAQEVMKTAKVEGGQRAGGGSSNSGSSRQRRDEPASEPFKDDDIPW